MEGIVSMLVIGLMATTVFGIPGITVESEDRAKRSYDDGVGGPTGYGGDSDEHDNASIDDRAPCGPLEDSGSPEGGYDFGDRSGHESQRGFSVKAAAAASSSTF